MSSSVPILLLDVPDDHQLVSFSLRAPNSSNSFAALPPPHIHSPLHLPVADVLKASALFLLVLWTILANLLVFIVLYKNPRLQTVPNLLVGNLAFSDFCLALVVLPLSSIYACAREWLFNETLCQVFVSADILCSTASIWNLSIVGLDRYWAITHPVQYLNKRNKKTACLMILTVWSFSALISLAPLLGWKQVAEHGNLVQIDGVWQCTFLDLPSYTVYSATGSFFIPTILMFFVYFKIYQAFAKHRARQIYRQKVIRRHIESTILHEISHILPTSDEFAKEVEEEDEEEEDDEEEGEEEEEEAKELTTRSREPENGMNPSLKRREGNQMHPTIYEENEEEEEEEEEEKDLIKEEDEEEDRMVRSGNRGRNCRPPRPRRMHSTSSLCGSQQPTEKNGSAVKEGTRKGVPTAKVAFKKAVEEVEEGEQKQKQQQQKAQGQRASILVKSKKQWKSFSHVEGSLVRTKIVQGSTETPMAKGTSGGAEKRISKCRSGAMDAETMPPYEKVRRHKRRKELNFRKSLQGKPRAISAAKERRGVRVLGIILGCFTLCWTPFFIMYVVLQFCSHCSVNPHIEMFITWLGYSNSGMNPIIYTVFNRDYQIALKRLFIGRRRAVTGSSLVVAPAGEGGGGRSALIKLSAKSPYVATTK